MLQQRGTEVTEVQTLAPPGQDPTPSQQQAGHFHRDRLPQDDPTADRLSGQVIPPHKQWRALQPGVSPVMLPRRGLNAIQAERRSRSGSMSRDTLSIPCQYRSWLRNCGRESPTVRSGTHLVQQDYRSLHRLVEQAAGRRTESRRHWYV